MSSSRDCGNRPAEPTDTLANAPSVMGRTVRNVRGGRQERFFGLLLPAAVAIVVGLHGAGATGGSTRGYTTSSVLQCPDGRMRRVSCANGGVPDEHTCLCRCFSPWSGPQCDWVGAGSALGSSGGDCAVYQHLPRAERHNSSSGVVFVDPTSGSGVYFRL